MGDRTIRDRFLEEALRFIRTASTIPGVRRIALMGSIVTEKLNPKDIDLLVTISDDADLAPLARAARRMQGTLQGLNRTADVFLIDEAERYLGRTCHWRDCRPGIRRACDAAHCGRRPYLHDDLGTISLRPATLAAVHVQVWPAVARGGPVPADVEQFLDAFQHAD
jgi:predicted nucleotidyltransferase